MSKKRQSNALAVGTFVAGLGWLNEYVTRTNLETKFGKLRQAYAAIVGELGVRANELASMVQDRNRWAVLAKDTEQKLADREQELAATKRELTMMEQKLSAAEQKLSAAEQKATEQKATEQKLT